MHRLRRVLQGARILPCFLPCLITREVAEGKTVDFVLAPYLGSESEGGMQLSVPSPMHANLVCFLGA
ncbi:uncharacterized protein B0T15DRAFT_543719 [Chaetomium strumarium]|uniref:Uncharacterized protein n=1 Tax=Chaetomium strumarium TaxID=1170767 RepID=A0AAJ0GMK0_9PEZI|nr:hypothetical protein B0T15DRAFT_543719 [Chaetomium strumarium]